MVHYKTELLLHRPVDARWIRNFLTFICCKTLFCLKRQKNKQLLRMENGPFLNEHFRRLVRYLMASTLARKKINLSIFQCDQIGLF